MTKSKPEPDKGQPDTRHYKRIIAAVPIPGTRSGHSVILSCGHRVITFGDLSQAAALCVRCREETAPDEE